MTSVVCANCAGVTEELKAQKEFLLFWLQNLSKQMETMGTKLDRAEASARLFRREVITKFELLQSAVCVESSRENSVDRVQGVEKFLPQENNADIPLNKNFSFPTQSQNSPAPGITSAIKMEPEEFEREEEEEVPLSNANYGEGAEKFLPQENNASIPEDKNCSFSMQSQNSPAPGITSAIKMEAEDFEPEEEVPLSDASYGEEPRASSSSVGITVEAARETIMNILGHHQSEAAFPYYCSKEMNKSHLQKDECNGATDTCGRPAHKQSELFLCRLCEKFVVNKEDSRMKHASMHLGLKPYKCPYCEWTTGFKSSIFRHTRSAHKDKRVAEPVWIMDRSEYNAQLCGKKLECFGV